MSTLVDHNDNRRRGDFISEEEYTAYLNRLAVAKKNEEERILLGGTPLAIQEQSYTGYGSSSDQPLIGQPLYTEPYEEQVGHGDTPACVVATCANTTDNVVAPASRIEPILPEYTDSMGSQHMQYEDEADQHTEHQQHAEIFLQEAGGAVPPALAHRNPIRGTTHCWGELPSRC